MKQPSTSSHSVKRVDLYLGSLAVSFGAAAAAGILAYGARSRNSQLFGPSVYRGPSVRRSIALTFDDGPSEQSLHLIEYLSRWNIPATFFQCGLNVQRHPAIARAIHAAGHQIGNHTYSHARLCPRFSRSPNVLSPAQVALEFNLAQEIIKSELGISPTLLRPPYGLRWFGMRSVQKQLQLLSVLWTVIGHDWEWQSDRIAKLVLCKASPGGIVCLHDGRDIQRAPNIEETLKAVKLIVPALIDDGYRFETVSQLLSPSGGVSDSVVGSPGEELRESN
jgi:peptidoglycan-N-acetylglucosamine deacetylase